ncbi:MAG: AAA family ATPase, partial [bacterium]
FKKGKSLFSLDVALSIAAGVPVLGKFKVHRPGPVIYLSGEGLAFLKQRYEAWHRTRGTWERHLDIPFHYVANVPQAAEPDDWQRYFDLIRDALGGRRPSLITIDTMSRSLGGLPENEAASMNIYEAMTRRIMEEFPCPCFTVAHAGKDDGKLLRGNSAALGNFDAFAQFEVAGDNRRITRTGRGDDPEPFEIKKQTTVWEGGHGETVMWAAADEAKGGKGGITRSEVGAALHTLASSNEAVLTKVLAEKLAATLGGTASSIRRYLDDNARGKFQAYVTHQGSGRNNDPRKWALPPVEEEAGL